MAAAAGDKVHILGHQPPGPNPPGPGDPWVEGAWPRLSMLVERYTEHVQVRSGFEWRTCRGVWPFQSQHADPPGFWFSRDCSSGMCTPTNGRCCEAATHRHRRRLEQGTGRRLVGSKVPQSPPDHCAATHRTDSTSALLREKLTGHVAQWCSGGGDYHPPKPDAFGAGVDGGCPVVPASWTAEKSVAACEQICETAHQCVGFSWCPSTVDGGNRNDTACCFRTGSVESKPKCGAADPTCTGNRCYEKASATSAMRCDGKAHTLLLPGVSLTEGWPATNPALRLLEFDPVTFALREAYTYYADLHAANAAPQRGPQWRLAYQFTKEYGMDDMTVGSFERLHADFTRPGSELWENYHGKAGGIYCTYYDVGHSPFAPIYPCIGWPDGMYNPDPTYPRGAVPIKDAWIAKLNVTILLA